MIEPAKRLRLHAPPRETIWAEWKEAIFDSPSTRVPTTACSARTLAPWLRAARDQPHVHQFSPGTASTSPAQGLRHPHRPRHADRRQEDDAPARQGRHELLPRSRSRSTTRRSTIWMNPGYSRDRLHRQGRRGCRRLVRLRHRAHRRRPSRWTNPVCLRGHLPAAGSPTASRLDGSMEIANLQASGRRRATTQVAHRLRSASAASSTDSRIWVMNGVLHPCDYVDVKEIIAGRSALSSRVAPREGDAEDAVARPVRS
jgi:hypothetical protein